MPAAADQELQTIRRVLALLMELPTEDRRRVLRYVSDRVDALPPLLARKDGAGEPDLLGAG